MTCDAGTFRAVGLVAALACVAALADCGEEDPGPQIECSRVGGVWDMTFDAGDGYTMHQYWTIAQHDCRLTITAYPPDDWGPLMGSNPVKGHALEGRLWATWSKPNGSNCFIAGNFNAAVTRTTLSGRLYASSSGYGGSCSSWHVTLPAEGLR